MGFDPRYVSEVLSENFKDAKALFLTPLVSIHRAHLVMLAERGIITRDHARRLRDALDAIRLSDVRAAAFDSSCEDLFFYVEAILERECGPDVAGRLHVARSRNDIDMTMYRMCQRRGVLALIEAVVELRRVLTGLASGHRDAVFAAHTHTQPAQPTTIAHYLLAVIEQLERDTVRLRAAYASTNRCPLGACAITGTGFPIDRSLTSELLGFEEPTGNTYGSIATVDYLLESVSAAAVMLAGMGRFVQDLLLWCTPEFGYLRLSDGFVQASSIMPQKRNPVALEHVRAIGSKALGQASAIVLTVHNTPFGDIVDTEDDLQPMVASFFRDALRAVTLLSALAAEARFDVDAMRARAGSGGTTLTELADHLVRSHDLPLRLAHAIARDLQDARATRPDAPLGMLLAEVSGRRLGSPLVYSDVDVEKVLSPDHFVGVRRVHGGPAPEEVGSALSEAEDLTSRDAAWAAGVRDALEGAGARLAQRSAAL